MNAKTTTSTALEVRTTFPVFEVLVTKSTKTSCKKTEPLRDSCLLSVKRLYDMEVIKINVFRNQKKSICLYAP